MSESPTPDSTSRPASIHGENRRETIFRWSIIGVLLGGTLVWMLISLFSEPAKPDNFTNSHSYSPGGHRALVELLQRNNREVSRGSTSLKAPRQEGFQGDTLVLLEPIPEYVRESEEAVKLLFADATRQPTSVIMVCPKRWYEYAEPDNTAPDDVLSVREFLHPTSAAEVVLRTAGYRRNLALVRVKAQSIHTFGPRGEVAHRTRCQLDGPVQVFSVRPEGRNAYDVLAETESGHPVALLVRGTDTNNRGGVVLVSDPDVFTNRYIARTGAAEFVMELFGRTPHGEIIIDEQLHGFTTDASVEYLAATPPGLYVTLSLVLVLLVFAWRQSTVVRPSRLEAPDRTDRMYAIEGVARMMMRTRDHRGATTRITRRSSLVLGQGAAQVGGPGGTTAVRTRSTGRISLQGENELENLMIAARKVAHLKRTGGAEHHGNEPTGSSN